MNNTQPVIRVSSVSKKFTIHSTKTLKERVVSLFRRRENSDFVALNNINLEVFEGETLGLVGHNGCGKSTLLKVIGGIIDPSSGAVEKRGQIAALLELGAGFHPDLTGRENIYLNAAVLGMTKQATDFVIDDIIEFSGIDRKFIDNQVKFYSSGMYVRLAFAVAVHSNPEILLVDEVLAVGDEPFQIKCMAKIREFQAKNKTIILVSHSAEQVADVCNRVVVLNHGNKIYDGAVAEGLIALRDSFEDQSDKPETHESRVLLPVVVESVLAHHDDEGNVRAISLGENLEIIITARVHEPTEWITGFTLKDTMGHTVYYLNTQGIKLELPSTPGHYEVRFMLKHVNFGSKRLVLSAGATSRDGALFNTVFAESELDVSVAQTSGGYLQFETTSQVLKL